MKIIKLSLFLFLLLSITIYSCNNNDDVVSTNEEHSVFEEWGGDSLVKKVYDDGSKQIVWGTKPNDDEMHYEWHYYKNGNLWLEGPMYDTLRHGKWKGYNEQGSLIAQGIYRLGKSTGIYTVWYDNGIKFYEGNMKDGKRIGEWSFFDKAGNKLKNIDYSKDQLGE